MHEYGRVERRQKVRDGGEEKKEKGKEEEGKEGEKEAPFAVEVVRHVFVSPRVILVF